MLAMVLHQTAPIESAPLLLQEFPVPEPRQNEIRIRVHTCGICHTDLHCIEGELPPPQLPIIPGHQIVGVVDKIGDSVSRFKCGVRVGVPWLYSTCGTCCYCQMGSENLCDSAQFTGFNVHGGYAEYMVVPAEFAYPIPETFSDIEAAPLFCSGVIGFRAFKLSNIQPGGTLGLFGFGSSAHIVLQIAKLYHCKVFVFTRSKQNQEFARTRGADWVGRAEDIPPSSLDSIIIFAPVGTLVQPALRVLRKGGTVALAGIYMTPIPELAYPLLYHERMIRTVANSTRTDVTDFLTLAAEIPIKPQTTVFPLAQANLALYQLKQSSIQGTGVLQIP
ncbi:MAG: zinc-dependent alcohol dehydrogenase family protein [bacterium]|nr:zinc-dependent alcohol dehydrogenase family protein [bacterium]